MTRREIPDEYLEGYAQILAEVGATRRRLTREELESLRARGERAAGAGFGLRALTPTSAVVEQAIDVFAEGHERAQRLAVRQERVEGDERRRHQGDRPQRAGIRV